MKQTKKRSGFRKRINEMVKRILVGLIILAIIVPPVPAENTFATSQDFSSCELLIKAENPSVFVEGTEVISNYNGIYLTRFASVEETESAYKYYSGISDIVEVNGCIRANDEASVTDATMQDPDSSDEIEIPEEPEEIDAFSTIENVPVSDCSGCIALIDTGASGENVICSISVLGDSGVDDNGHGTILASAISGANPEARILSIKALDSSSIGTVSDVYAAIEYAIRSRVSVINLSMCSIMTADSEILRLAISDAVNSGIKVVASAGNNGKDASYYTPANISSVYTIGAADIQGKRIESSNFGELVDYYVVADSTSVAAARFSAYLLNGIDTLEGREDVFTREYTENYIPEEATESTEATETTEEGLVDAYMESFSEGYVEGTPGNEIGSYPETSENEYPEEIFDSAVRDFEDNNSENTIEDDANNTIENDIENDLENDTESAESHYSLPSIKDEEGTALPSTMMMGVNTPSSSEFAEEVLLRGALNESSSWAECLNTIYGFGVNQQAVDDRPSGYPRWINATGMAINNGTGSGVSSNYTGAIASFGTLTSYDGDSIENFTLYGSDDPSVVHTACYDHHIGINKSVPPLGVQSIESINFEYAGYDSSGWYYYCAIIQDWANSGHQRIFAYICIKRDEEPQQEEITYYYAFGVSKKDLDTDLGIPGVTFDIYTEDWGIKIGTFTTSGTDGVAYRRWSDSEYYGREFRVRLIEVGAPDGYQGNIGKRFGPFGVKGASENPSPKTDGEFDFTEIGIQAEIKNELDSYYFGIGVDKRNEKDNKPIEGIKFDVYSAKDLNSEKLGSTITTNSNGTGYTTWVKKSRTAPQVYLYESFAPDPFKENIGKWYGPFTADGPNASEETVNKVYSINNSPKYYGAVAIYKNDAVSKANLSGITFDIYTSQNLSSTKLGEIVTNREGKGSLKWSADTQYSKVYAYERYAPYPYDKNIGKWFELQVMNGYTIISDTAIQYSNISNTPRYRGYVGVIKKDSISNKNIKDVVFDIYTSQNTSSTKLGTITTGENGKETLSWESQNKYSTVYAYEKAAPYPYEGNVGKWYTLSVSENANGIVYTEAGNTTEYNVEISKKSANLDVTDGNPNYDLDGTTFEIYRKSDDSLCGKIEVDSNGNTKNALNITKWMNAKDGGGYLDTVFYYKEIAFGRNYSETNLGKTGEFTVLSTERSKRVEVTDQPDIDTIKLSILKKDQTGAQADLSGAEFTLNYYMLDAGEDSDYSLEQLSEEIATRSWIIATDEDNVAILDDEHKLSGDSFYIDGESGNIGIPMGWLTIEETKEPDDYLKDEEISIIKIDSSSIKNDVLNIVSSSYMDSNGEGILIETPIRADFALEKNDYETGEPMSGVEFEITNTTTGESHTIKTDELGQYDSSKVEHSSEEGIWFSKNKDGGEGDVVDDLGALSIGDYEIKEVKCDANEGYQLEPVKTFSVTADDNNKVFKIFDETGVETEEKIHNVKEPYIRTTAKVVETDSHSLAQNEKQTIEDDVEYWYLGSGRTYTLVGRLMVKEDDGTVHPYKKVEMLEDGTLNETDEELTSVLVFTTEAEYHRSFFEQCGIKTMTFDSVIPLSKDEGKTYVVYEYLYEGEYDLGEIPSAGEPCVVHEEDIYDQSIYVPSGETQASDSITGTNIAYPTKTTLKDVMTYTGLTPGDTYHLETKIYVKKDRSVEGITVDEEAIKGNLLKDSQGNAITMEKDFIPETIDGTVEITAEVDLTEYAGESLVFLEYVYKEGLLIFMHEDINSTSQTIHVPDLKTKAKGQDETNLLDAEEDISFRDCLMYFNILPETEYTAVGYVMDAATGEAIIIDGNPVSAKKSFVTPAANRENGGVDGNIDVEFELDASGLEGKTIVIFEELYLGDSPNDENLVGEHKDKNDTDQQLRFKEKPEEEIPKTITSKTTTEQPTTEIPTTTETIVSEDKPTVEKTEKETLTNAPKTGDTAALKVVEIIMLLSGVAIVYLLYKKK